MNNILYKKLFTLALISILVFSYFQSRSQVVDSENTIRDIKVSVFEFLIKEEGLERKAKIEDYENRTYITELSDQTILGYDQIGIYVFGIFTSHTKRFLLLKNGAMHKILDPENLSFTLHEVTNFLLSQKTPNDKVIVYVESIIKIHQINENRNPAKLESKK